MFKKILVSIVVIFVVIAIFASGLYTGIYLAASMKSTTMLQDYFIQSTQGMTALNYLDVGKQEQARQFLILNLDANILGIDVLAEHADKKTHETACNILTAIAKHRKDHPEKYSSYSYPTDNQQSKDIRKEIARVLYKWELCKK